MLYHWIRCERVGRIGGLSFHAARWHQKARDEWIGRDDRTRRANLGLLVMNSRLLTLPGIRVPHLASHVPGMPVRRLADDWMAEQRDTAGHRLHFHRPGACGHLHRRRTGCAGTNPGCRPRLACSVWMRPLERRWRERLRRQDVILIVAL